ncbi:YggT family protein [Clostridium tertium]|uniref:YggT family protein n=1 Tax=Clostridium tertium TaxID=1559 RepID=UPI003CC920D1
MGIIFTAINLITRVLEITIFAEVIMSILPSIRESAFYELIALFNNPILKPFRFLQDKILRNSMIDFSPLFAIMLLSYIRMLF